MRLNSWLERLCHRLVHAGKNNGRRRPSVRQSANPALECLEDRRMLSGQTITVDVLGDTTVAGHTTLRDAIDIANADTGNTDTIVFDPSLSGTITLTQGNLNLSNSMTIVGTGAANLAISGNNSSSIFRINVGVNVNLSALTLTNGDFMIGGAIENDGTLTITQSVFTANQAMSGAAIANFGTLNSAGNTYEGNSSFGGGAITNYGTAISTNDTVVNNAGAGISNYSDLTTVNVTVAGNSTGVLNNGQWTSFNTVIAGNGVNGSPLLPDDVENFGSSINATNTIVGDASTSGGIQNGINGNQTGVSLSSIFATDLNDSIVLGNNGGPTSTVALAAGSVALGAGADLTTLTADIDGSTNTLSVGSTSLFYVGETIRVDHEFMQITAIVDGSTLTVSRAQNGSQGQSHLNGGGVALGTDQRGDIRGVTDVGAYAPTRTIVVDTLADTSAPGTTTLRDAITEANAAPAGDVITFANGLTGTITLTQGTFFISNAMTISSPGADELTISANMGSQIFVVNGTPGMVTISGLTLTNAWSGIGGAISNYGELTVSDSVITNNQAMMLGGGIYNSGSLVVERTTLSNNSTMMMFGGAIYNGGTLVSNSSTISGNSGMYVSGVYNGGTWTSTNDTISGNSGGNAVVNDGTTTMVNDTIAGNSYLGVSNNGTWTVLNSIIVGNTNTPGILIPNDVSLNGGTIDAANSVFGFVTGAGIVGGLNGNVVGVMPSDVLATDIMMLPILANNGGPTQTVALTSASLAKNAGTSLAVTTGIDAVNTTLAVDTTRYLAVGDLISIDDEVVLVTAITDATDVVVARGQLGTVAASHTAGTSVNLATDQTGSRRVHNDVGAVTIGHFAPSGTSATLTTPEGIAYTFQAADFGFTDPNDANPDLFTAVKVTLLPTLGTLTDNGAAVTQNQMISIADINAGKLVFTPNSNTPGTVFVMKFQVKDNGGTANGGADTDPTPKVLSMAISAVNHAPVGTAKTVTAYEDRVYTFRTADFGFTDPNDHPANSLSTVTMTSTPALGQLTDDGIAVTAGAVISAADLAAGKLRYLAPANANGTAFASLTFQVQDNGGTANGGVDTDPTPRQLTIDVASVNDAPTGAWGTVSTFENQAYTLQTADFGFQDANDSPGNNLSAVRIYTLPTAGTLTDNGIALSAYQYVPVADITGGKLVFTPTTNYYGTYFLAMFQVQDDGGRLNGGLDVDVTPRALRINITHVNQAPVGTSGTVTVLQNSTYTFKSANFGFMDPNDAPRNALQAVVIDSLPALGTLTNNGVAVTVGAVIAVADINSGKLKYTPTVDGTGSGFANFQFRVQDNGGTANGVQDTDLTSRTLTIDIAAPVGQSATINSLLNTPYTLQTSDFGFADPLQNSDNSRLAVRILALPNSGSLTCNGNAVTTYQYITAADISAGKLVFTPTSHLKGVYFLNLFQVFDTAGLGSGGMSLSPANFSLRVNLIAQNQAPSGNDHTVTMPHNTTYTLKLNDFGFSDSGNTPPNTLLAVKITSIPTLGTLTDAGTPVTAGTFVSRADIVGGKLKYMPATNGVGTSYSSFTFQVQDNGGTLLGGADTDPTPRLMTFNVTGPYFGN